MRLLALTTRLIQWKSMLARSAPCLRWVKLRRTQSEQMYSGLPLRADIVRCNWYVANGKPYRNTYTWYFQMRDAKVVKAIAFSCSLWSAGPAERKLADFRDGSISTKLDCPRHVRSIPDSDRIADILGRQLCAKATDSSTAANHVIAVDTSRLIIPFGFERERRGCRGCRKGSPGSDAGSCPRRAPADGLVRLH
jgi:hypothetical protein